MAPQIMYGANGNNIPVLNVESNSAPIDLKKHDKLHSKTKTGEQQHLL